MANYGTKNLANISCNRTHQFFLFYYLFTFSFHYIYKYLQYHVISFYKIFYTMSA